MIINFPNRLCYHQIKVLLVIKAYRSWPDVLRHLYGTEMGRRDTGSPRYGYGLGSAQSLVESNIKQTVVLFIYILQQITSCVGSYILQVLLL